jgi:hypothetical protein
MAKLKKIMVVHHDPNVSWEKVEENWRKLANVESATWVRTYFNKKEGVRYCVWLASNAEDLKKIFSDLAISWESILETEETVPDLWGKTWEVHLEVEGKADTLAF